MHAVRPKSADRIPYPAFNRRARRHMHGDLMTRRPRLLLAACLYTIVAMAGAIGATATTAATPVRYVDDDGRASAAGCNASAVAYSHIQTAVDNSVGDTT